MLAVLAENKSTQQVLAFAFDGTGLGTDNTLWGGEALIADAYRFHRIACLKPFKLIGGEQAIKHPVRLLLSILLEKYSLQEIMCFSIPAIDKLSTITLSNLTKLWKKAPENKGTSSIGRLFDVVAVLLNLIDKTQYEGQAGMLLETAANQAESYILIKKNDDRKAVIKTTSNQMLRDVDNIHFDMKLSTNNQWDPAVLIEQILDAVMSQPLTQLRTTFIAKAFMNAIASSLCDVAKQYPQLPIVLTGGCFKTATS